MILESYLLEKSRIVYQGDGERNYHIFYCMLAGLSKEHKAKLDLKEPKQYNYLIGGGSTVCEGRDDAAEYADIRSAMKVLMMSEQDIWDILKILAASGNVLATFGKILQPLMTFGNFYQFLSISDSVQQS